MSSNNHFDILVIGSGPAGQKAAIQGAKAGKRVALVERSQQVGGACVQHGTIPSKTLRESALNMVRFRRTSNVFDFRLRDDLTVPALIQRHGKRLPLQYQTHRLLNLQHSIQHDRLSNRMQQSTQKCAFHIVSSDPRNFLGIKT